ncbi:Nuclear receptor corepressor 1 [Leucoagaricus sp. SymC.cos]|nr:Nuclear receptor corepressor 1 [Leucoagaricus sp. SymC.cos]
MSTGGSDVNTNPMVYQQYEPRRSSGSFLASNFNKTQSWFPLFHESGSQLLLQRSSLLSRSPVSRPSSRSSIASSVPSEKPYTPSRSTLPLAPDPTSPRGDAESGETSAETKSTTDRKSPSPCPPGLRSLNEGQNSSILENETMDIDTPPFRAQINEDDITEEAEVTEILSQNQSPLDLPRDQGHQISPPVDHPKDRPEGPSQSAGANVVSHSPSALKSPTSGISIAVNAQTGFTGQGGTAAIAGVTEGEVSNTAFPTLSPSSPTSTVAAPPNGDLQTNESSQSLGSIVNGTPSKDTEVLKKAPVVRPRLARPSIMARRVSTAIHDTPTPTPTNEPIRRTASKSFPPTPFPEPPVPPLSTETMIEIRPALMEPLKMVVKTRLLCDRQTREERVSPVLLANLSLAPKPDVDMNREPDAESVVREVIEGPRFARQAQSFEILKPSLVEFFSRRQALINDKIQQLKQDYVQLQEKWQRHCRLLNEQAKPSLLEGESMPIGRTTRRTANLGDAVRSDLEMEQILASLENNDAMDPHYLSQHNLATIPDMISVKNGQIDYLYDDTSHRVENPVDYYAPHTGIHDWTEEEKKVFLDKYAAYPKQFGIIADYLPNKTSSQCVDYYYLHKKNSIDFRKVVSKFGPKRRRRGAGKRKGNALLTDIQKHDEEVHRGSMLVSLSAAPSTAGRQKATEKAIEKAKQKEKEKETVNEEKDDEKEKVGDEKEKEKEEKDEQEQKQNEGMEMNSTGRKRVSMRSSNKRTASQMQDRTPTETPTPEPEVKSRRKPPEPEVKGRRKRGAAIAAARIRKLMAEDEDNTPEPEARPAKRTKRARKIKSAAIVEDEPSTPEMETKPLPDGPISAPPTTIKKAPAQALQQDKSRWPSQSIVTPS